jgi:phosphonate transport system substrate-binding protein
MDALRRLLISSPLALAAANASAETRPVTFAITPVILDEQAQFMSIWQDYLQQRLQMPLRFVQRGNYREILGLLLDGQIDFAWLCGYPYVRHRKSLSLVVSPVYQGAPLYQSYLIVESDDRQTRSITDLRGKVFAYSDPDSNSGWLTPQVELKRKGLDATSFFGKPFFTWSHRKVIEAVAAGLAQGGAVDGYIWDTLQQLHPELTARTRVAWRSERFGFPPIVAGPAVPTILKGKMQSELLAMQDKVEGRRLLARLNLDGFARVPDRLYDAIERNWRYLAN